MLAEGGLQVRQVEQELGIVNAHKLALFIQAGAGNQAVNVRMELHPRMDTSDQVWFANDQLAVRFIEEIDFDYVAEDATAALLTAAT